MDELGNKGTYEDKTELDLTVHMQHTHSQQPPSPATSRKLIMT